MKTSNKVVYALYRGDTFIDVGTDVELANNLGIRPGTIRGYASAKYRRTTTEEAYRAVRIGKEVDFREEES